jgi:hypothetical protein
MSAKQAERECFMNTESQISLGYGSQSAYPSSAFPILDQILALQLKIARAGELERLSWWRVDATDADGGGDFYQRLLGKASRQAAAETAMAGAKARELILFQERGIAEGSIYTLFHPPFKLDVALRERWQHFKNYPEDLPSELAQLLDHELSFDKGEFEAWLQTLPRPSFERSTLGRRMRGDWPAGDLERMQSLAALLIPLEVKYPLPYYPADAAQND